MYEIKIIAIAGAGTMGSGIAQVAASAGFTTILYDLNKESLIKAKESIEKSLKYLVDKQRITTVDLETIQNRISYTSDILEVKADLIIEAIIENLDIKHTFFQTVASNNHNSCILATNTSSIPITQIAVKIPFPNRVVGIHFFNPAPIMKLVEIVSGVQTDPKIVNDCKIVIHKMGKTCVLAQDSPGFIVNRVARHFYVEGLKILEENVADFETIDQLMECSGFKMGPFRLMDLIGVDTNFSVTNSMFQLFHQDTKFRPSRIQQQKVDAGLNGKKSGKGFYAY
jgi:3-hydroxybutyryl-CoA dehydrogenase